MNFTKLTSLFKDCHQISVVQHGGDLWIGNGAAQYRVEGKIETDDEGILSLLNVPLDKKTEFKVSRNSENVVNIIREAEIKENEINAQMLPLGFTDQGKKVRVYATKHGAVMFNQKLIDIAADKETTECIFLNGKTPMLSVWRDELQAVICPMQTLTERSLLTIERFVAQVKLARENRILLPNEPEQLELDDYPF